MPTKDNPKSWRRRFEKLFRGRRAASPAPSATLSIINSQSSEQGEVIRLSTEPRPTDHHEPVAASQVPRLATPVEPLPKPAATEPAATEPAATEPTDLSNPTLSTSQRLWNAAYDDLEASDAELVGLYVKTLREVLGGETGEPSTTALLAEMKDPVKRQIQMRELVKKGQEKILKASRITTRVGGIVGFALSTKAIVDPVLQSVPQAAPAALPWAGVCLGLQMLLNPAQAIESNRVGIDYVISRMDWYCALTKHLLEKDNIAGNNFQEVLRQLEKRIIELYKALLLYQIKSICSYYRNQGLVFLGNMIGLNNWDDNLKLVTDAETAVRNDADQYYQEQTRAFLGTLGKNTKDFILFQKDVHRDNTESAFRRDLRVVDPQDDMERIENNKDKLLDDAHNWIFDTEAYATFTNWEDSGRGCPPRQLLWIKGHAGTGKTMLMIGLIRRFSHQPAAIAPGLSFFFCQDTDTNLNNATAVLRSLIWLLLLQQPHLISHLLQKYKDSGSTLFTDPNAFVALSKAFLSMLEDKRLLPVYFAVDALDECSEQRTELIQLISTSLTLSKKVKWLLSSRPEVDVLSKLITPGTLIELDTQRLRDPVQAYIKHKLTTFKERDGYNDEVLATVSNEVGQRAGDTFLWAALAFKFLEEIDGSYAIEYITEIPPGLSKLYGHMMTRIENGKKVKPQDCKKVLEAMFLAFRPLYLSELVAITGLHPDRAKGAVNECGSFITMTRERVDLIHQSAKDYLKANYTFTLRPAGVAQGHMDIIKRSINAISSLKQNIYGLDYGFKPEDMTPPDQDPLAPLRYSCVYWVDHLCSLNGENPECFEEVFEFLKKGFLRWLESLSLLGKVPDGVLSIGKLMQLVQSQMGINSRLIKLLTDAEKFVLSHRSIIEQAPLQTYGSALVFSPITSEVRNQYWKERISFIEVTAGIQGHWGAHQQTLEGHIGSVRTVAFSRDGKRLASGSENSTIRLWDAKTGAYQQTLEEHSGSVYAVAFSHDSKKLASGSKDKTVRLWDTKTGIHQQTLKRHDHWVNTVTFSRDSKKLASGSLDKTIRLWDAETGAHQTLEGHSSGVHTITFSRDGKKLASGSIDKTVRLWDAETGAHQQTLKGHNNWVNTVTFSCDGKRLASGSSDKTIQLWDAETGAHQQTLKGHNNWVNTVTFSRDSKRLASGSSDKTIRLWDTETGAHQQTLEGHSGSVYSVTFSRDSKRLASGSTDNTIRFWDAKTSIYQQTLEKHSSRVHIIILSRDSKKLASGSDDNTIRL